MQCTLRVSRVRSFLLCTVFSCACLLSFSGFRRSLKPFLIRSDSASRIRPFLTRILLTGLFWSFFLISTVRSIFIVLMLFLKSVGVREYCCTAVEICWQLGLSFALSPRARAQRTLVSASWWLCRPVQYINHEQQIIINGAAVCQQRGVSTAIFKAKAYLAQLYISSDQQYANPM